MAVVREMVDKPKVMRLDGSSYVGEPTVGSWYVWAQHIDGALEYCMSARYEGKNIFYSEDGMEFEEDEGYSTLGYLQEREWPVDARIEQWVSTLSAERIQEFRLYEAYERYWAIIKEPIEGIERFRSVDLLNHSDLISFKSGVAEFNNSLCAEFMSKVTPYPLEVCHEWCEDK